MAMDERLTAVEAQVRRLRLYLSFMTLVLLAGAAVAFRQHSAGDQIIRTHGIIIVDDAGRERILIGAPIPDAKDRLRTNLTRVDSAWAGQFPPGTYMKYYAAYRNAMSGMLVLDEHGIDRVMIGDSLPDPNIGRRIGSDVGVLVNDRNGFERSGYGLLTVRGQDRMVLGLDTDHGTEGVALAVIDSGRVGVHIDGRDFSSFFGTAPASDSVGGVGQDFNGLFMKHGAVAKRVAP
jgi:hypothetical protein